MPSGGADLLSGDEGDDRLETIRVDGTIGTPVLRGGEGRDYFTLGWPDEGTAFDIDGGPGSDHGSTWSQGTPHGRALRLDTAQGEVSVEGVVRGRIASVERFELAAPYRYTFAGSAASEFVWTWSGLPFVANGQGGDDTIKGGHGDDSLFGGPGRDQIDGLRGNDLCRAESKSRCER